MHRLRIVFTCLCAYLPRKDDVLVVIPDGRNGHAHPGNGHAPPGNGHGGHHHGPKEAAGVPPDVPVIQHDGPPAAASAVPPHIPVIQFDPAELSPESEIKPHFFFRHPSARREQALFFLTGEDITLDPSPAGRPTLAAGRTYGSQAPESAAEAADFSWVAEVAKLDPAAGAMDPACAAFGTSAGDRVAARVKLSGGKMEALLLGQDRKSGKPIVFDFVDAKAPANLTTSYSQALAAAVAYDLAVSSEEVALVLTPYKHPPKRLVFSFKGLSVGHTIQVLVKNMPLDGVLQLSDTIQPGRTIEVDPHFAMYYALSQTPPKTFWIPDGDPARYTSICPSARFAEAAPGGVS